MSHRAGTDASGRHNIFWYLLRDSGAAPEQIEQWTSAQLDPTPAGTNWLHTHYEITDSEMALLAAANEVGWRALRRLVNIWDRDQRVGGQDLAGAPRRG